jgi:EAL domain-containing protein (putative c-di-GMP-specific phosphodiesterase class I)
LVHAVRFFDSTRRHTDERLLWSRDVRFVHRLAEVVPDSRTLELDSGAVLIAASAHLTELVAHRVAVDSRDAQFGLATVDSGLPEADRYLTALSEAVQVSGLADRIGMSQTTQVVQTKTLDYFFSLRALHAVAFQPIVELETGALHEYECLFRPSMPMLPQSIGAIVQAAIDTDRSTELDTFVVATILAKAARIEAERGEPALLPRIAINLTPASLLDRHFEASAFAALVREAGLDPRRITIECTEQQTVDDVVPLKRAVRGLRRAGFGFAVDDAGAGYASFALIAALRPTVIKIDRDIIAGIARDDAKQALVEAFVSFGRRIGARLCAEGIERRADLAMTTALGVDLGQGYLIARPSETPAMPRPMELLRLDGARQVRAAKSLATRSADSAKTASRAVTPRPRATASD